MEEVKNVATLGHSDLMIAELEGLVKQVKELGCDGFAVSFVTTCGQVTSHWMHNYTAIRHFALVGSLENLKVDILKETDKMKKEEP